MYGESGYDTLYDSNHDGHFNALERDHAECALHDCDTFDQVLKKENSFPTSYNGQRKPAMKREFTQEEIDRILKTEPIFKPDSEKTIDERHPILFPFLFCSVIIILFAILGIFYGQPRL